MTENLQATFHMLDRRRDQELFCVLKGLSSSNSRCTRAFSGFWKHNSERHFQNWLEIKAFYFDLPFYLESKLVSEVEASLNQGDCILSWSFPYDSDKAIRFYYDHKTKAFAEHLNLSKDGFENKTPEDYLGFIRTYYQLISKGWVLLQIITVNRRVFKCTLNMKWTYFWCCEEWRYMHQNTIADGVNKRLSNIEFYLAFHTPKNDWIDLCEEVSVDRKNGTALSEDIRLFFVKHLKWKLAMKTDKDKDQLLATSFLCPD